MQRIYERVCGLDVHRDSILACLSVPGPEPGSYQSSLRRYGTMTADLLALRDWLAAEGVTHVAMESTGVLWKSVYYLLEQEFQVLLCNAQHLKQVPGRKTDSKDAEWIAQLLGAGLLRGSFVPPEPIRDLRELVRYRKRLVENRTQEILRLHRLLQDAGIKLSSVATNILGVSGRAMIQQLIGGQQDPEALAELACGQLRKKLPQLRRALRGRFREEHAFLAGEILAHIDYIEEALARLQQQIEDKMAPYEEQAALLKTIPGVQDRTAEVIVAEMGVDMTVFPSPRHLASWARLCPGNRESAGKRRRQPIGKGNRNLRTALYEAAWAAIRKGDNYLAARYRRLVGRRGKKRAVTAVAHSILVICWHILKNKTPYRDLGEDYFVRLNHEAIRRRCLRQLQKLGYQVELRTQAA